MLSANVSHGRALAKAVLASCALGWAEGGPAFAKPSAEQFQAEALLLSSIFLSGSHRGAAQNNHGFRNKTPILASEVEPQCSLRHRYSTTILASRLTQLDKKQDFAKTGQVDGTTWLVVMDGHGTNHVMDWVRALDDHQWKEIMKAPDSIGKLRDGIALLGNTLGSGATCSIVKISGDQITCSWVGDSQILVYQSGSRVFESKNHDGSHEKEETRMKNLECAKKGNDFKMLGACHAPKAWTEKEKILLDLKPASKLRWTLAQGYNPDGKWVTDEVNITRALGHNQKTDSATDTGSITMQPGHQYRVLVASDGLHDVICHDDDKFLANSSKDIDNIMEMASRRWKKPCTMRLDRTFEVTLDMKQLARLKQRLHEGRKVTGKNEEDDVLDNIEQDDELVGGRVGEDGKHKLVVLEDGESLDTILSKHPLDQSSTVLLQFRRRVEWQNQYHEIHDDIGLALWDGAVFSSVW